MFTPLTTADAELSARSVQVPLTDWFASSAERIVGAGGLLGANPERLSEHWKLTVTFVLFQPWPFGTGERTGVIVGGVLSNLIVRVFGASTLRELSVPKKVIVVMPSVLTVKEEDEPATTVLAIVWAPLVL